MRDVHVVTCFLLRRGPSAGSGQALRPGSGQALRPGSGQAEVLLLRRSERVGTYRGRWAGVSGYLEAEPPPSPGSGQALEQAYREMEEEVGLTRQDVRLLAQGQPLIVPDESIDTRWTVHPFLFELLRPERVRLDWEHRESRWVRPEEMRALETVPGLAEALARVYPGAG